MSGPRGIPLKEPSGETSGTSSSPTAAPAPPETAPTATETVTTPATAPSPAQVLPPSPEGSPSQQAQGSEILPASHWAQQPVGQILY